jgi:hypothetical protein
MNHAPPVCLSVLEEPRCGQYRTTPTPDPVSSAVDTTMLASVPVVANFLRVVTR